MHGVGHHVAANNYIAIMVYANEGLRLRFFLESFLLHGRNDQNVESLNKLKVETTYQVIQSDLFIPYLEVT